MNCRGVQSSFDERLDGRLNAAGQQRFDDHIATCVECREQWKDYAAAWQTLARHEAIEPSYGFTERTLRRLHEPEAVSVPAWWRPFALRWTTAASLALVLGLSSWVGWRHYQGLKQARIYAAVQEVDFLGDDFDVIASLDQLDKGNQL